MLVAAMLAMVLAAAAPALGQQIGGDQGPVGGEDAVQAGDNIQYSAVCQNVVGWFQASAVQVAAADADAAAGDNAAAVAEIAQEQNLSVSQVNECLNAFFASASATTAAHVQYGGGGGGGGSASASATALPATGGMVPSSVFALGAGALLVGGGLLARRIVR
jgi:LPXTG-motif cell wall-anchored protein